jgi:hypothetical protein
MGRGGEIHSHPKFCTDKKQGAMVGYPDGMAQLLSEVFRPLVESISHRVAALR